MIIQLEAMIMYIPINNTHGFIMLCGGCISSNL